MALGNLASRFLVAVVAVPVILFLLYLDSPVPAWGLIFGGSLVAMYEFFAMTIEDRSDRIAGLVCGALAAAAAYWMSPAALPHHGAWALLSRGHEAVLALTVMAPALYYLFRYGDMATVARRFAFTVTGIIYCGLLFGALAALKRDYPGAVGGHLVVLVLIIAWLGDTGAYFAGRFLGNSKLYPAVSPKKTWAGAFGGLAGSVAGALVMKVLFLDWLTWVDVILLAAPGAVLGQLGDLAESLLKRSVGVKDSGALLPGHGGILDRIDAVLFIAPYTLLYLQARTFFTAL